MRFYVSKTDDPYRFDPPGKPPSVPCGWLVQNTWDDYSYNTQFSLHFFDERGELFSIGETKILDITEDIYTTCLSGYFEGPLPDSYCSLGQSLDYYDRLSRLGAVWRDEILRALRDVVAMPELYIQFRDSPGFDASLKRFSEAEKALKEGGRFFGRMPITRTGLAFTFSCTLPGFTQPHQLSVDFTEKLGHPHRITAFVGKNGVGKSGVLACLAAAFSGHNRSAGQFQPGRPEFGRTICISYSVFQPFEVPKTNSTSYRYCGLRNNNNIVDLSQLDYKTLDSIRTLWTNGRKNQWCELMRIDGGLLDTLPVIRGSSDEAVTIEHIADTLKRLSSGQRIIVSLVSDLLEHLDQQSLILFDEPEIYLHPTLLSTLLRLLHKLLEDFDSYAIVATHSPIVIQEIPARSVMTFFREGSVPLIQNLPIESLGANLTDLVDLVFAMNDDDKNYKTILKGLASFYSYDHILSLFGRQLSLNARIYLKSIQSPAG